MDLLAFTVNFQGGLAGGLLQQTDLGDRRLHPRRVRCVRSLRTGCARLLDAADEQGMVVIIGYFYFWAVAPGLPATKQSSERPIQPRGGCWTAVGATYSWR